MRQGKTTATPGLQFRRVAALLLGLVVVGLAFWPRSLAAHLRGRSYCTVETATGGLDVSLQVPVEHLRETLGLAAQQPDDAAILAAGPRLVRQVEDSVRAASAAGACEVATSGPSLIGGGATERQAVVELRFSCPPGPVTLTNRFRAEVEPLAETLCAVNGEAWVFRAGAYEKGVGAPPRIAEVVAHFVKLGGEHVLTGVDHVLFLLSLLLGARGAAGDVPGKAVLRRVVWLVTGFTLGHSVTLLLATLGVYSPPARLTESLIALSIVAVAVQNMLSKQARGTAWASTAFGLIHGFGFASALRDMGLPRRGLAPALLSFNVGIELAQLAIVAVVLPPLVWAGRRRWFRARVVLPASGLFALLGMLWLVKRSLALPGLTWLGS